MLPAKQRMNSREVEKLCASPHHLHGEYLHIMYTKAGSAKASVTVSKKIVKKAVDRNHWRRRLYHALRIHWDSIPPDTHLLLVLKKEGVGVSFKKLELEVGKLLKRLSARV
ncbi:MAG: ribonuclease P protein component [Patescibacteria group bacterium]